jgi:hypothetical protein
MAAKGRIQTADVSGEAWSSGQGYVEPTGYAASMQGVF